MSPATRRWRVGADEAGGRLDTALAVKADVARSQVSRWLELGLVTVDGRPAHKAGERLRLAAWIEWTAPPQPDSRIVPEAGELSLLHLDDDLIALDKPAGLVVHPGAGRPSGTLVHRLLERFPEIASVGGAGRPGIVHRLDRGTSGVMLVARSRTAYSALIRAFAERAIDKRYLALVHGTPDRPAGEIDLPIGRHPVDRKRMTVRRDGRPARTGWRRIASAGSISLLELRLHTGRTHQIRVHLRQLGLPLVGDPVYGRRDETRAPLGRPALHAWRLALAHPISGAPLDLLAPAPGDLVDAWREITHGAWPNPKAG